MTSEDMLSLLGGTWPHSSSNAPTIQVLQVYFETQEIFISRLISLSVTSLFSTFSAFTSSYLNVATIIFIGYLACQIILVIFARKYMLNNMRSDLFESRGILNMIPNQFFVQNRQLVESIMQKLKD